MSALRRSRVAPRALWVAARVAAPASARLSSAAAAAIWFVPWQRRTPDPDHLAILGPGERSRLGGGEVVVHSRGEGPTVLLVHGWADRATSMAGFIDPLVAAGRRVVAVDLPAHGDAPGRWTAGPQAARVIAALVEMYDVQAVVAHSFGALATSRALHLAHTPSLRRAAFLAPLLGIAEALAAFGTEARLPKRTLHALERRMERRFGSQVWDEFATDRNLANRPLDGLIVHDTDDRRLGIEHARQLHAAWPGASLLATTGLGHNRLLRDPAVVDAVVTHVTEGSNARSVA